MKRKHEIIRSMRFNLRDGIKKESEIPAENRGFVNFLDNDAFKNYQSKIHSPKSHSPKLFPSAQAKKIVLMNHWDNWIRKRVRGNMGSFE